MTTSCYFLEDTFEVHNVIEEIEEMFPCFTDQEDPQDGFFIWYVHCREEDLAGIEKRLAPVI